MRIAPAIAVGLLACNSPKPCTRCDCGRAGVFQLDVVVPTLAMGEWTSDDQALTHGTLTYGDDDDGHSTSIIGTTVDGGTVTVAANHQLGLNPALEPTAVSWYAEDDYNYQSKAAALSFADRGAQLIVHGGAPSMHEGPVLAPVTAYAIDLDAGTVSVTIDDQTITAPSHHQVPFTRHGAPWCLAADDVGYHFAPLSHWAMFQLDALAQF